MLRNYIKIAFRTMRRQPGHFAINVLGLSIGLVCCLLMLLFVRHELSYDKHNAHAEEVFRLVRSRSAMTAGPMGPALKQDFPGVGWMTRITGEEGITVSTGPDDTFVDDVYFADADFVEVFDLEFVEGDPETALEDPFGLVITRAAAQKYFGAEAAMGKTLTLHFEEMTPFRVSGVINDPPGASHFDFDLVASFELVASQNERIENWQTNWLFTYGRLTPDASLAQIEEQLPAFFERHTGEAWDTFRLQPLLDIRLHSAAFTHDIAPQGNIIYLYLFGSTACLILLIGCINFTNLSTAKSMQRAREIGVRKVLGARKQQLAGQFLGETVVSVAIALGIALLLLAWVLPAFEAFAGVEQSLLHGADIFYLVPAALLLGLVVTAFAGGYPAFVLSAFQPIASIRGQGEVGRSGWLRKGLVVFQFAASVILIVSTLMIQRQMHFIQHANLGFEREQVVVLDFGEALEERYETIKQAFMQHSGILGASAADNIPTRGVSDFYFKPEGFTDEENLPSFDSYFIDASYTDLLDIDVVRGEGFTAGRSTGSEGFLINETAWREIAEAADDDWTNPIGKQLDFYLPGQEGWEVFRQGQVIGVVEDFHYESLHARVGPLVLQVLPQVFDYLLLKVHTEDLPGTLAFIEEQWQLLGPDRPFEYVFLDDHFDGMYRSEARMTAVFEVFAVLAVCIACLGLLGLAALSTARRRKEIGVRKVLGASFAGLVHTLTTDYMKLVGIAFLIAAPIAFFAMQWWLQTFAYRVDFSWGLLGLAGVIVYAVAWLSAASQTLLTARLDPVETLYHE